MQKIKINIANRINSFKEVIEEEREKKRKLKLKLMQKEKEASIKRQLEIQENEIKRKKFEIKEIPIIFTDRQQGVSKIPKLEIFRTLINLAILTLNRYKKENCKVLS